MRKMLIAASILMPLSAHADLNQQMDLMDMQDEFELRQMGLDDASMRMNRMEIEMEQLRWRLEEANRPNARYHVEQPPAFDPKTFVPTGEPFYFPQTKR